MKTTSEPLDPEKVQKEATRKKSELLRFVFVVRKYCLDIFYNLFTAIRTVIRQKSSLRIFSLRQIQNI